MTLFKSEPWCNHDHMYAALENFKSVDIVKGICSHCRFSAVPEYSEFEAGIFGL